MGLLVKFYLNNMYLYTRLPGTVEEVVHCSRGQPEGQYGLKYSLQSREQSSSIDTGYICQGNGAHGVIQTIDILCTWRTLD